MVDQVANLGIKVDSTGVVKADKHLDRLAKTSKKTEKATDALTGSTQRATSIFNMYSGSASRSASATQALTQSQATNTKITQGMTAAWRSLSVVIVGFAGIQGARALAGISDEAINISNRLRQVTDTTEEMNSVFGKLVALSNETRSSLSSTSILFQRLTMSSQDLNLTQEETLRLTETINKAMSISGATTSEAAGAIRQLSQGLAAGALRGDEFNSVAEQAPAIMRAIAKETNLSLGALREFAATGGITAEIVISALKSAEHEIDVNFAKSVGNFGAQMEQINTQFIQWAANNDSLRNSMGALGAGIGVLATGAIVLLENLDTIAVVMVAKLLPALQATVTARIAATVATQAALASEAALAVATHKTTLFELEKAMAVRASTAADLMAEQVRLKAQISLTGRNMSLARSIELSRANAGATVLLNKAVAANAAAITSAAVAQTAYNVTARAGLAVTGLLSGAMALVGGPVGVALIAAFAIWKFIDSIETATEKTARLTAEVGDLSEEFKNLSANALANESIKINATLNDTFTAISKVKGAIADLEIKAGAFDEMSQGAARANSNLAKQKKVLEDLVKEQIRLGVASDAVVKAQNKLFDASIADMFKEAAKRSSDYEKTLTKVFTKYGDLVSVIGMTARETAIYNDVTRNGIDLKSAEGMALLELIDLHFDNIDALNAAKKATKELEKAAVESARKQQKAYDDAFSFTSDLFEDTINDWESGWQGFADNVVNIIKKMLVRMVAEYTASGVLQLLSITGGGSGALGAIAGGFSLGGGNVGAPGSTAGLLGNVANFGKSIFSGGKELFSGFFGASQGAGAAQGAGLTVDLGATASGFTTAVDGLANGLAEAAPWASALAGALMGFERSGLKGAATGAAGGFLGATAGAEAGATIGTLILPGLGTAIGGALGAIIGGVLGSSLGSKVFGGDYKTKDFGVQLAVAAGNLVAESFEKQKKEGGLFSSTKRRTIVSDLDFETGDTFKSAVKDIQKQILTAYDVLGVELGNNVFKSFSTATVKISTKGKSDEQITAALNTYFENLTEQMVSHIGELSGITFARLTELGAVLQFANVALEAFGADLLESSIKGAEAAENLVAIAGGFEAFQMAVTNFNDKFVEQRSDFELATDVLTDIFGALGSDLPATREAVASFVESLDLMTTAGQMSFATITGLANELDAFYTEIERLEQQRVDDALATAAELAAIAEAATAEALRITEAATAALMVLAEQRVDLEIEIMRLTGDSIGALAIERQRELDALDDSLKPLQQRIFDLQDEATATAAAAEAAKDAVAAENELTRVREKSTDTALSVFKKAVALERSMLTGNISTLSSVSGDVSSALGGSSNLSKGGARSNIESAITAIGNGDFSGLGDIGKSIDVLTSTSEKDFATQLDFKRDQAATKKLLTELKSVTDAELTIQEQELESLNSMAENMTTLVEVQRGTHIATLSVVDALNNLNSALGIEQVNVPSFANGGLHAGGLRLVGERGPELEVTGPSRIMNAQQLMGGDAVPELRKLNEKLSSVGFQVAKNTLQIRKQLNRWDVDGMPPIRLTS